MTTGPTFTQDNPGFAAPGFASAHDSNPVRMGWMQGSPPPPDRVIRFADNSNRTFPQLRWAFSHTRELVPTRGIARHTGGTPVPTWTLPRAPREAEIDALDFTPTGAARTITWADSLQANYTDGIVVLHRGRIVYERYAGALSEHGQHIAMSVTKSFTGLLAAWLAHEGVFDPKRSVADHVPDMAGCAFGDATVRQVMDMTTALKYSENYADPNAEIFDYVRAGHVISRPATYQGPEGFLAYLLTLLKEGNHGQGFMYKTVNSDALAWVLHRTSGSDMASLLQERIWSRLGMEQDASISVDAIGTPFAGGGLSTGLRDLARFGEMLRLGGSFNGQKIFDKAVIDDTGKGGDREKFKMGGMAFRPGYSYRNQWWVLHNADGAYEAAGIHGQFIHVNPAAEMVVVKLSSHPVAGAGFTHPLTLKAWAALAQAVRR